MLMENGVLSDRRALQPRAEGRRATRRARTRRQITATAWMNRRAIRIVGIAVSRGRVATRTITTRRSLDHPVRRGHLHVGRRLWWSVRANLGKPRRRRRRGGRARARARRRVGIVMELTAGRGREQTAVSRGHAGEGRRRRRRRAHPGRGG